MNQDLIRQQPGDITPPSSRMPVPRIAPDLVRPRLPELGRIRLGEKKGPKGYPSKLEAFRFTSRDEALMQVVAERFGGEVTPWMSDEGPQFQVYSEATSLEVVVPKAELAFSQWFENWDGAVCRRRCNGHWETVKDTACVCNPINRDCLPTTRLSVLLPDIPGMGVWRVESHGFNAAAEILGTIELAAASGATLLPAKLMLTQRTKRRLNPKTGKAETNKFVVPVLVIDASLREMVAEQDAIRRRTLGLLPMAERADEGRMRALRTAVFTRWPKSVDEPERTKRLAQLSEMLGRPVATISMEHDLTMEEAIKLTDTVDSLPPEPAEEPESLMDALRASVEATKREPRHGDPVPVTGAQADDQWEWSEPEGAGEEASPGAGDATLGEVQTHPAPAEQPLYTRGRDQTEFDLAPAELIPVGSEHVMGEEELQALRETARATVMGLLHSDPKRWGAWFRAAGPAVHKAYWDPERFPLGWSAAELEELLARARKEESL